LNARDEQQYAWVPPATFAMGCSEDDQECDLDETPHEVTISQGFWIGQTEITQKAYLKVMGTNPSNYKTNDSRAVTHISWFDAKKFCESVGMRLPTEAEWELAARGPGHPSVVRYGPLDVVAWYMKNSDSQIRPVGEKAPNGFGLYDMLGNVEEWTADFHANLPDTAQRDPKGPLSGNSHAIRGGSWTDAARSLRVSARHGLAPEANSNLMGARCAGQLP